MPYRHTYVLLALTRSWHQKAEYYGLWSVLSPSALPDHTNRATQIQTPCHADHKVAQYLDVVFPVLSRCKSTLAPLLFKDVPGPPVMLAIRLAGRTTPRETLDKYWPGPQCTSSSLAPTVHTTLKVTS